MFIELTTLDNTQVFIRTDDVRRIIETPKGTKLVFADGDSLLVKELSVEVYHELTGLEDNADPTGGMGIWP